MKSKLIIGSTIGLAAIAVAVDHTKHRLPEPAPVQQGIIILNDNNSSDASPCSLGDTAPCGLGDSTPCGL